MTSISNVVMILVLVFISCNSKHEHQNEKRPTEIIGLFTAVDKISEKMADSLQCEGIKYKLKINNDSTYSFIWTCPDSSHRIFFSESGRWKLIDGKSLKLISKSSGRWLLEIDQSKNFITFLKKDDVKLSYQYQLTRDSTYKE